MTLSSRLRDKTARVGVMGLGYVGLPLAMEFCRKGFSVSGFDVDEARVARLKRGRSYVLDVADEELAGNVKSGRLAVSAQFEGLSRCDAVLICVQTPLRKTKEPDLGNIVSAAQAVARQPRAGRLVIVESTTFPGATQEIVKPILEEGGKKLGKDFYLAFSPERVDPGNSLYGIANTPKVVGGCDDASGRLAVELYSEIVSQVVAVSSTTAAEMAKLLENSFRSVNIALVNEMAQICHRLGLNVWEIIGAAATKPFGFMPFFPGPGIGGHCIPKDPQLLAWKMKTLNFEPRFIQLATAINGSMPRYAVERVGAMLNAAKLPLNGSRVLVLGVAYKPDTSDFRESPALDVIQLLLEAGARVTYHDPFVPQVKLGAKTLASMKLTDAALRSADCVAVMTAHKEIDYHRVAALSRRVFDARNALKGVPASEGKVERL